MNFFHFPDNFSTIATTPLSNLLLSPTLGGMTETEMRNIFGPEITRKEFTPASAESMAIASILLPSATVMLRRQFS
jgi:hypothetical protein